MNPLSVNPLALLGAAFLAIAVGFGTGWEVNGWRLGADIAKLQRQAEQLSADAATRHAADVDAARTREQALEALFNAERDQRLKEEQDHAKTLDYWRGRVRAGADRLRVDIDPSSLPACGKGADPGAAGRPGTAAAANVVPAVADTVLSIAADDGRLVRDYNRLLKLYGAARDACNTDTMTKPPTYP